MVSVSSDVDLGVAALVFDPGRDGRGFALWVSGAILVLCAVVVAVMYLYLVLSGGVMGFEERESYLEKRREARRGRS